LRRRYGLWDRSADATDSRLGSTADSRLPDSEQSRLPTDTHNRHQPPRHNGHQSEPRRTAARPITSESPRALTRAQQLIPALPAHRTASRSLRLLRCGYRANATGRTDLLAQPCRLPPPSDSPPPSPSLHAVPQLGRRKHGLSDARSEATNTLRLLTRHLRSHNPNALIAVVISSPANSADHSSAITGIHPRNRQ
jgi:hypothetical protein